MRNTIFNIAGRTGISTILRKMKGDGITVLSLHRISEEKDFFFPPITPTTFEALIRYCIRNYEIISFSDIDKRTKKPKLILSFDDGYYDFIEFAIPILDRYELPSNHNLVNSCLSDNAVIWTQKMNDIFNFLKNNSITDDEIISRESGKFNNNWISYYISFFHKLLRLDSAERNKILAQLASKYNILSVYKMMNWNDAIICKDKHNVEIGSHTYHHESLFSITDPAELDEEIGKSIAELESKLKTKINVFALPNGQYNEHVLQYCREKGIEYFLLANDKITPAADLRRGFNLINRINMVNEGINEMILRTELFHSKFRKLI